MHKKYDSSRFEAIIHLPHHVSNVHPQLSMESRAAQFSPFAALTGYEDAVKETARITEGKMELDEDTMAAIDEQLHQIQREIDRKPCVTITYFQPDVYKEGGSYVTENVRIKKIDLVEKKLIATDGQCIAIAGIVKLLPQEENDNGRK